MPAIRVHVDPGHTAAENGTMAIPVGVVVPYDMALDRELRRFSQDGFGFEQLDMLFTRTPFESLAVTVEQAHAISRPELVAEAVRALAASNPAGYIYGCTSGSFARGLEGERLLTAAMQTAGRESAAVACAVDASLESARLTTACPSSRSGDLPMAVTASGALLEAVRALGATTVAAATPYDEAVSSLFAGFFPEAGVGLVRTSDLGLRGRIWSVPWQTVYELVRRADTAEAQAVLICCTNLPTYEILDRLEQDLGKPVVSANQAAVWAALRHLGRDYLGPGAALRGLTAPAPAVFSSSTVPTHQIAPQEAHAI